MAKVKITLAVPESKKNINAFILSEMTQSNNIKDSNYREQVKKGLRRIFFVAKPGKVTLYDGDNEELDVFDYPLKEFIYKCGKEFVIPNVNLGNKYLLVVLDQNDATIAELTGTGKMKILWSDKSHIGGKHKTGGQSSPRMERARQLERKHWFRKIAAKMKEIYYSEDRK